MLTSLQLKPIPLQFPGTVPSLLKPLVNASALGQDLAPTIVQITKSLGFDNFMHGVSLSIHPNSESHSFVFTTLPMEWVVIYDQRAYLEVDPRIQFGIESSLPFIWDQASVRGKSPVTDMFLDAAAEYGVASGISISLRDSHARGGITALSSANPVIDTARRERITEKIGDIMAFGQYFHELFITNILDLKLPPASRGAPLSARERQCLLMSANGLTSFDIGAKLGISERTANFHFGNIISKLGVLNRKEAVARAVAQGLIHLEQ
jgi:DNA-binding CsgD family transcriptional regulator